MPCRLAQPTYWWHSEAGPPSRHSTCWTFLFQLICCSRSAPRRGRRGMKSSRRSVRQLSDDQPGTPYGVLLPDCWQNFGNCIVVWAPSHPGSTSLLADFPAFRILGFGKVWHTISRTQSRNAANGPRPTVQLVQLRLQHTKRDGDTDSLAAVISPLPLQTFLLTACGTAIHWPIPPSG